MEKTVVAIIFILGTLGMFQFTSAREAVKAASSDAAAVKTAEAAPVIQIKQIEAFSYCCIEMTGSYEQHSTAFMTLYGAVGSQALNPLGEPFGVYYNDPETTPEEQLKWEIGLPIAAGIEIKEPLKLKEWTFRQLASRIYEGPFDEMAPVYMEALEWIKKNGFVFAGPPMEKFLGQPAQNEKGQWAGKVEILLPVEKAK